MFCAFSPHKSHWSGADCVNHKNKKTIFNDGNNTE
jgi:hypothetical protein